MKSLATFLSVLMLAALSLTAAAENSTHTGGYTIHHNALTTDNLPSQVATAYGLQRSKNRALLNVSVIRDEPGTMGTPVHASIRAVARTLYGQIRPVELREIVEDKAIYYIADFPVAHRETLMFDFEIMPEGGRYPLRAHMRQEFFTN
ncbi:MAG TPA: DUF4426 domain-containing protein [Gammaproteobacteria bacterium]|nr:DUF4426 domain-containing protein [Gammaproteobacteria bacterium]